MQRHPPLRSGGGGSPQSGLTEGAFGLALQMLQPFDRARRGNGLATWLHLGLLSLRFAHLFFGLHLTFGHRFRLSATEAGIRPSFKGGG